MDSIGEFLEYIIVELNRSRLTADAYGRDIRDFAAWTGAAVPAEWDYASVTASDIRAWLGEQARHGAKPVTIRRKTQSLRAFYHWARRRNLVTKNPAAEIVLAKLPKPLPQFARENEVEEILSRPCLTFAERRARFAVLMLYSLGLRQAELLTITDADISRTALEIKITGKRSKQRVVPVPPALMEEIEAWQRLRDEKYPGLPHPAPLLAGPHGALSKESLYRMVHEALAPVHATKKSPHLLRHSFATAMLADGGDLNSVKEMLGHASLQTTQVYTHLSFRQLRENYNAHPRAGQLTECEVKNKNEEKANRQKSGKK